MYKIVPAERQDCPKETITKTAVNHRKTAYSGHFGTPGETRTHYIPLRREVTPIYYRVPQYPYTFYCEILTQKGLYCKCFFVHILLRIMSL